MYKMYSFFYRQILFIMYFIQIDYCKVYAGDLWEQESKLNTLIEKLHSMYKDAFENEKTYITRRFFARDGHSHYTLHVEKLKEVHGVKTHNLRIEGRSKREDPIIYINNPVEARMPNPFLSIDQFKKNMFERVEKQKKEFNVNRNLLINAKKQLKVFKHLEHFPTEIFDVKKHVKQVVDVINNTELTTKKSTAKFMKTALHNGTNKGNRKIKLKVHAKSTTESTNFSDELIDTVRHKVNKKKAHKVHAKSAKESTNFSDKLIDTVPHKVNQKRAHKVHVSRGTKSTRIPHIMTTSTLPKTVADEKITTESTADEEITTETTADQGIITETIAAEKIKTETPINVEVTTETPDQKNTTQTTVDHEIIAETTADNGITTATIADLKVKGEETNTEIIINKEVTTEITDKEEIIADDRITTETIANEEVKEEEINTEIIINKEITTEITDKEEIITEPVTTTEQTVRTKRAKLLRPLVFMGER